MKAIEVLVNGKRLCIAGSQAPGFTFAYLTAYDGQLPQVAGSLMVAGQRDKMTVSWTSDFHKIQEGDDVRLRIVDVVEADPPLDSQPSWTEFPRVKIEYPEGEPPRIERPNRDTEA